MYVPDKEVQAKPDFITTWDCLFRVARNVGGGGGHKLTVKNFKMTLLHKSPLDWIILCYILCFWYIIGPKFDNSCRVCGIFCNVPFAHDLYLFVHKLNQLQKHVQQIKSSHRLQSIGADNSGPQQKSTLSHSFQMSYSATRKHCNG